MKIKVRKTGEVVEAWNPSTEPEPDWFKHDTVSDWCLENYPTAIWSRQGNWVTQILPHAFDDRYEVVDDE